MTIEEMIAEGYDEAVRQGAPFHTEEKILAGGSADPVAVTEADPLSADQLADLDLDGSRERRMDGGGVRG